MELELDSLHIVAAYVALLLGVLGPVIALVYSARVERRSFWRVPMLVSGALSFAAVLTVYLSGRHLVSEQPRLLHEPGVAAHVAYADRLLVPATGYFLLAMMTGLLNPRSGALRIVLPLLLSMLAALVLVLVLLSGDSGARNLFDRLLERF